jgi:endonuclease/exonuclease/phosphatase family metal-dependent hydrolase
MAATTFSLMTANLLNGRADPGHFAAVIDRVRPDLVVTQEMAPDAAEVIASRFPHHALLPDLDHRGRGIASRFDAEFEPLDLPWRPGFWARVDLGGPNLSVAGIHLLNPVAFPWWRSVPGRGDQIDALFSWADQTIEPDQPLVVAGDINATPVWPVYRRLNERWDDLVAKVGEGSAKKPAPTWGWRPGWPRMLRIDHVFGSGVQPVGSTVEPLSGSDHAALVVAMKRTDDP